MPSNQDPLAKYRPTAGSQITFVEFTLDDAVDMFYADDEQPKMADAALKAYQTLENADKANIRRIRHEVNAIEHDNHNAFAEFFNNVSREAVKKVANLDEAEPRPAGVNDTIADNVFRYRTPLINTSVAQIIETADIDRNHKNRLMRFLSQLPECRQDEADEVVSQALNAHADALATTMDAISASMVEQIDQMMQKPEKENPA